LIVPPPFSVSSRTAPATLLVPETISSLATAGCQVFNALKFFTVSQTLAAGAAMVADFLTCSTRAAAWADPAAAKNIANAVAMIVFIVLTSCLIPPPRGLYMASHRRVLRPAVSTRAAQTRKAAPLSRP